MDQQAVLLATKRWIASIVIKLNLCPFAQRVYQDDRIRYVVSNAVEPEQLLDELTHELDLLAATPLAEIETTLLIHPHALNDFLDYNDFLDDCDRVIKRCRLRGVIQIASFHPDYQFAGTDAEDVENYTNRSPYPMLHLLREDSISAVASDQEVLLEIPRRNMATLQALGKEHLVRELRAIKGASTTSTGANNAEATEST